MMHADRSLIPGAPPPGATRQPQGEYAMDLATSRLGGVSVPIDKLLRPSECPADLLPWLAWALSVDEWDSGWSEATKRQVLMDSVELHRRKGTAGAMKRAVRPWGDAKVLENIGPNLLDGTADLDGSRILDGGDRAPLALDGSVNLNGSVNLDGYSIVGYWAWFGLELDLFGLLNEAFAEDGQETLLRAVKHAQPARSHLRYIQYRGDVEDGVNATATPFIQSTVYPAAGKDVLAGPDTIAGPISLGTSFLNGSRHLDGSTYLGVDEDLEVIYEPDLYQLAGDVLLDGDRMLGVRIAA